MVQPRRAAVRPRVYSPNTGDALLLEDVVRSLVEAKARGVLGLVGGPGAGKSTALAHLADVFADERNLDLLDAGDAIVAETRNSLVVRAGAEAPARNDLGMYRLAPWQQDEWIEYLLTAHRSQCAAVLQRARSAGGWEQLQGVPELWQVVLEEMAGPDPPVDIRAAFRRRIEALCHWPGQVALVRRACLAASASAGDWVSSSFGEGEEIRRLIRHRPVQVLLGSEQLVEDLRSGGPYKFLTTRLPLDLIEATAACIRSDEAILERLRRFVAASKARYHAMAASLLHAAKANWRPSPGKVLDLTGAHLRHAEWSGVQLPHCKLEGADLGLADLRGACLDHAAARGIQLHAANLRKASLTQIAASGADMTRADLGEVQALHAQFDGANLEEANLENADLRRSNLSGANLTGAKLTSAKLNGADLRQAQVQKTDFTQADLSGALLAGLRLEEAYLDGARLVKADLNNCNLEYVALWGANCSQAKLDNALLTGSVMPAADFTGASLQQAGLADVDWPNASLRDADLRGASFHLGSTRSGLVGSPIACEGSRTGFYTDDYNDQDFKPPEEIRKANLRGADLRGARIESVDFYLVDLRDARFDTSQEEQLRATGAILD